MQKRFIVGLMSAFLGLALSLSVQAEPTLRGKHLALQLPCEACHGTIKPREVPEEKDCLKCHGSRKIIADRSKALKPNPHFGHDDSVTCVDCHKVHEPSVLTCDQCHQFGYKTP